MEAKPKIELERLFPAHDNLIVQVASPEELSAGGIIIPDKAQEKRFVATVMKIGPDVPPGQVEIGDQIIAGMYSLMHDEIVAEIGENWQVLGWKDVAIVVKPRGV